MVLSGFYLKVVFFLDKLDTFDTYSLRKITHGYFQLTTTKDNATIYSTHSTELTIAAYVKLAAFMCNFVFILSKLRSTRMTIDQIIPPIKIMPEVR